MKTQKSPFFKKYEVLDALGEGGFGRVVKARHQILGQVFAIKQLAPGLVASEEDYERFVREAQAMAQLEHPHIVTIYDADVESGFPYLVMEFVEGRDVHRIVTEDGPLAVAEAVRLGREIASALAHMHAHGIVHRDVKTSNLLRREADGHYFLTDFGLALQSDLSRITTAVMGSRVYMSPEQIEGQAVPASDQYSLGVVLFEVLTGRPPFVLDGEHGAALVQFVQQVHHAPPPSMTRFRLEVPEWLDDVVARCLRKDPADRFPDMQALEQALSAGSAGTAAAPAGAPPAADRAAEPASTVAPAKPGTARWGRWLALGLAVVLVGALLVHLAGRPGGADAPPGEAVAGGAVGVDAPPQEEDAAAEEPPADENPDDPPPEPQRPADEEEDPAPQDDAAPRDEEPAEEEPEAAPGLTQAEARGLADSYLNYSARNGTEHIAARYAEQVDYFDRGRVSRAAVVADKGDYLRRWPRREYERTSDVTVRTVPEGTQIRFNYRYVVRNDTRMATGEGWVLLTVAEGNGDYHIVSEKGGVYGSAEQNP